ncbi:ABC-three component system protein [Jeotgalicoccus nanhaiensis]|nr:ABC-three component system protein [Jeotgalicoccus nanhaiensis]
MTNSVMDDFYEIEEPKYNRTLSNKQLIMGKNMPPIDRLKIISADEFEELIEEWIYGYLRPKYKKVQKIKKVIRLAGSGDKGRDVVAFKKYSKDGSEIWDNYQCKHYSSALTPSEMWVEFGKLCYYTYIGEYSVPQNYYFVSTRGVGPKLSDLLMKPDKLRDELIANWDKHCLKNISEKEVRLVDEFKEYVEKFDFSIFESINPGELINQYKDTIYFSFRFGGGLTERPKPLKEPAKVKQEEQMYVKKLYNAYSDHKKVEINNLVKLEEHQYLFSHFKRQRNYFYQAESLRVFDRDSKPDGLDGFEEMKNEVYHGIVDIVYDEYKDGFERVRAATREAKALALSSNNALRDFADIPVKMGICHHLANEKKPDSADEILWVIDYEQ